MKHILLFLFCLMIGSHASAEPAEACSHWPSWFKPICEQLNQTWTDGDNELYLTGYAWHNRYLYPKKKLDTYNEAAWGGGLGKSLYDKDGDWNGLYAIAFLDSHKNIEPVIGYAFLKMAHVTPELGMGIGYSVLVTARRDIFHNIPFPGILPLISVSYRQVTAAATYIPVSQGAGNVLFCYVKYIFQE